MGIVKKTKAATLAEEARRAVVEGRTVFAAMMNTPWTVVNYQTSGSVSGWAEMIEAVEAEGWRLSMWSTSVDTKGRPQAYPLFRRA